MACGAIAACGFRWGWGEEKKKGPNRYVAFYCITGFGGRAKLIKKSRTKTYFWWIESVLATAMDHTSSNIISRDIYLLRNGAKFRYLSF
jgi:hypothetical protein